MARTVAQIQQSMIDTITSDDNLSNINSISKTAIWRLFTYVFAYCVYALEVIQDNVVLEIQTLIAKMKPHTQKWYAEKCKAFQYGYDLPADSDLYDNTGLTDTVVEASKIIKYVAVIDQERGLRIKVATGTDEITPLSTPQKNAFIEYLKRIKDAGVKIIVDSLPADLLKLSLQIYYDPLILTSDGSRVDGTNATPVQNAVKDYLKALPFNGVFVLEYLIDALQKIEGVEIPHVVTAQAKYGSLPYSTITVKYLPDAGYLKFDSDADLEIEFIAQSKLSLAMNYLLNFKSLVRWLVPQEIHFNDLLAFLDACVKEIKVAYNKFLLQRDSFIYYLTITPQVCYLEKLLNNRYDYFERRIYITDGQSFDAVYLYQKSEDKPIFVYKKTESTAPKTYLYKKSETGNDADDFVVNVPNTLVYSASELRALVDSFKLAGTVYSVNQV